MTPRKQLAAVLATAALAIGSTQLFAEPPAYGGYGPGYGPGMMHGYGPGFGMGPGGMHGRGYAMGPGMGGFGMGRGMGPGAMWGYGGGFGSGAAYGQNLTDEQRSKVAQIQQELQRSQWELMGKMHQAYAGGFNAKDDEGARATYENIAALRKQMFDNALAARKQIDAVVTQPRDQSKAK